VITNSHGETFLNKVEATNSTRKQRGRQKRCENDPQLPIKDTRSQSLAKSLQQIAKEGDPNETRNVEIENVVRCLLQDVIKGDYNFTLIKHEGIKGIIKIAQSVKNDVYHVIKENERSINDGEVLRNLLAFTPDKNRIITALVFIAIRAHEKFHSIQLVKKHI